jgi:hypothetical protein
MQYWFFAIRKGGGGAVKTKDYWFFRIILYMDNWFFCNKEGLVKTSFLTKRKMCVYLI